MLKKIVAWTLLAAGGVILIAADPMIGAGFSLVLVANELLRG